MSRVLGEAYWLLYRKQREAAYVVREAKRKGELVVGACAHEADECRGRIEAHHEDYDKPLEIVWLCVRHHRRLHADRRRAAQITRADRTPRTSARPAPTPGG